MFYQFNMVRWVEMQGLNDANKHFGILDAKYQTKYITTVWLSG